MGRYLFRRKTLSLAAFLLAFPFIPPALFAEFSGAGKEGAEIPRYASRQVRRAEDYPAAAPRQFHGGEEVFSAAFRLSAEAKSQLDRIRGSARETQWILAALERAKPYAHFIRQKIAEYGLPPEIFYLPVVESLYKIGAHSRSGALGLWQFLYARAHPWMKINDWIDERKDFWKSTEAAMEKLLYNYKITGDWLLALAAYNCGLGKIRRIMRQSGLSDFWEISRRGLLPRETGAYVPRLIATAHFASALGRAGFPLKWEPPVRWRRVRLEKPVDIRLLAQSAGIPEGELALGNAELRYGITPPAENYQLKVKAVHAAEVEKALAKPDGKLMRFALHTIARGHTLSEIARHYGIPVSLITRYNPGVRAEALRVGARLVVPLYRDVGPYVKETPPAAGRTAARGYASPYKNAYTVREGDSLWAIARSFGITSADLAAANGIPENGILRPGTSLKVP